MKLIIFFLFSNLVFVPSVFAHCGTCGKGDSHKAAATCEKDKDGKCAECKKDKDGKCAECKDCSDKAKSDGGSATATPNQQGDQPKKAAPAAAPQDQQTTGATGQGNKK